MVAYYLTDYVFKNDCINCMLHCTDNQDRKDAYGTVPLWLPNCLVLLSHNIIKWAS